MLKETFFLYMEKAILSLAGSGSSLLASIPVKIWSSCPWRFLRSDNIVFRPYQLYVYKDLHVGIKFF